MSRCNSLSSFERESEGGRNPAWRGDRRRKKGPGDHPSPCRRWGRRQPHNRRKPAPISAIGDFDFLSCPYTCPERVPPALSAPLKLRNQIPCRITSAGLPVGSNQGHHRLRDSGQQRRQNPSVPGAPRTQSALRIPQRQGRLIRYFRNSATYPESQAARSFSPILGPR